MSTVQRSRFPKGALIFREGESGDCAYIIKSGFAEVFVGSGRDKVVLATLGPGEILGEMSILDGSPRSASVVAKVPCDMIVVSHAALAERYSAADPILRLMVSVLMRRIRQSNLDRGGKPKKRAKGGLALLEPSDLADQRNEVLERLQIESELKEALSDDEFFLHYQPIVDMGTRQVAGFEALIRWNVPGRGLMRPDIFMGIAEETSLIIPIGEWVIERACADLARLEALSRDRGLKAPFVAINISGRQFQSDSLFTHLMDCVRRHNVEPANLKLEVTERVLLTGSDAFTGIEYARELGFPVALDDFGTGYSSLNYLSQFPVDTLKIDMSFVRKVPIDPRTSVVTQAVVQMCLGLGTAVVAEGIENEAEMQAMSEMACSYAQGYLFSKPMIFEDACDYFVVHGRPSEEEDIGVAS